MKNTGQKKPNSVLVNSTECFNWSDIVGCQDCIVSSMALTCNIKSLTDKNISNGNLDVFLVIKISIFFHDV